MLSSGREIGGDLAVPRDAGDLLRRFLWHLHRHGRRVTQALVQRQPGLEKVVVVGAGEDDALLRLRQRGGDGAGLDAVQQRDVHAVAIQQIGDEVVRIGPRDATLRAARIHPRHAAIWMLEAQRHAGNTLEIRALRRKRSSQAFGIPGASVSMPGTIGWTSQSITSRRVSVGMSMGAPFGAVAATLSSEAPGSSVEP